MSPTLATRRVAVFGARSRSLGDRVVSRVVKAGHEARSWGVSGEEDELFFDEVWTPLDVALETQNRLENWQATDVVITVGINEPVSVEDRNLHITLSRALHTNVALPVAVMQGALAAGARSVVLISSNSANIARTNSLPYCASKAALSMAVRVAARERAGHGIVYAYEPGLLSSTPMTRASADSFDGALHRIPGLPPRAGLDVGAFAQVIVDNILNPTIAFNGATIRLDGGEQ